MSSQIDSELRDILTRVRRIAIIGASDNPARPSNYVAQYLAARGYQVHAVNPGLAGRTMFGHPVVATLSEIEADIDMVDIFRRSEHVPAIVDEALTSLPDLDVIWMQIGVTHAVAAEKAQARGITVVQDRCPKIEYHRFFGDRHLKDL